MAAETEISWCDSTWSAWYGCSKVSLACDHCYAENLNKRFHSGENWGPGAPRRPASDANWKVPVSWQRNHAKFFAQHGRRRRVFLNNQADIFDNEVDQSWREAVWDLIEATPDINWLLLTKRIGNAKKMLPARWAGHLPDNVWLGITVIDQEEADRDVPKLLECHAIVLYLSVEPMLGPIRLEKWLWQCCGNTVGGAEYYGQVEEVCCGNPDVIDQLSWVIVGGESGHGARPMRANWVRGLRNECKAAGVAFHLKQHGEFAPLRITREQFEHPLRKHIGEMFDYLDIHHEEIEVMRRVGKKTAGRELDGATHDAFPEYCK